MQKFALEMAKISKILLYTNSSTDCSPHNREARQSESDLGLVYCTQKEEGISWELQVASRLTWRGSIWIDLSSSMIIQQKGFSNFSTYRAHAVKKEGR